MNLQGIVDDPVREFAGKELRETCGLDVIATVILLPCGAKHHEPRVLDLGEHVDELERDRLELADRLSKGLAILRVRERFIVGAHREPDGKGRYRDASAIEDREKLPVSL